MEQKAGFARARALFLVLAIALAGNMPVVAAPVPDSDQPPLVIQAFLNSLLDWVPGLGSLAERPAGAGDFDSTGSVTAEATGATGDALGDGEVLDSLDATGGDPTEDPERGGHLDPNG